MNLVEAFQRSDKFISFSLIISTILSFLVLTIYLIYYPLLPPKLPLFYSLPWGQSQLVAKPEFVLLPGMLLILTLVNSLIVYHLHESQEVLKKMLMSTLVILSLIISITGIRIIYIFI